MAGPYDIGGNSQPLSPNFSNFQVLPSAPPSAFTGRSYYDTTLGIGVWANGQWNYASGGGGGTIASVFGRTGTITAQSGDYTFSQVSNTPTTVSGYGITDGVTLTGTQVLTNKTISGSSNTLSNVPQSAITGLSTSLAGKQSTYTYYGNLYNKSSFANTSDFTTNGATASISGSAIAISGGTSAGDLTHSLDYTYDTQLDNWIIEATLVVPTVTSTSFGLGIGMKSSNTGYVASLQGFVDLSSGANAGKIGLTGGSAVPLTFATTISATAMTFVAGNVIYLRMERKGAIVVLTAKNQSNSSAVIEIQFNFDLSSSGNAQLPNTGRFAIFSNGDSQNLTSFKISSNVVIGADYAVVGDSKSLGFSANSYSSSWVGQLSNYANVVNLSGSGDKIVDVQRRQAEIIALAPKVVLLNIGRNDIGVNACNLNGTIQTNFQALVTALQGAGIIVLILQPFFETTCSMTSFNTFITSTYSASILIDTFTPTTNLGSAGVAADSIHPNQVGHDIIFNAIRTSGKVNGLYQNRNLLSINKLGLKNQVPFYNGDNELGTSTQLTFNPTTNAMFSGGMNVFTSFSQFTNISLNGSTATSNPNFLSGTTDQNLYINRPTSSNIVFRENNATQQLIIKSGGNVGIGTSTSPTALLHINTASTTSAGTSPLKFASGTLMTTPEAGAFEFDATNLFFSVSTTRYTLAKTLTTTATLDFASTIAGTNTDLTVTLTGAAVGDIVELGVPNASIVVNSCFTAWVSATNTVTVRFNNYDLTTARDPASGTFRVSVLKY